MRKAVAGHSCHETDKLVQRPSAKGMHVVGLVSPVFHAARAARHATASSDGKLKNSSNGVPTLQPTPHMHVLTCKSIKR